jgi:hypothetical protein
MKLTHSKAGYKWLKYVPNSFIKAAQNAEWKVHAWKLGKPPTIVYEGIGFDPRAPAAAPAAAASLKLSNGYAPLTAEALRVMERPDTPKSPFRKEEDGRLGVPSTSNTPIPRNSLGGWSDYDDLADFEGRFGSQTTLATPPVPPLPEGVQAAPIGGKRKASRGIFGILKGPPSPSSHTPSPESSSTTVAAAKNPPKLKGLRSISSLKGKLSASKSASTASKPTTPKLETDLESIGAGLGIDVDFRANKESSTEDSIEAWASAVNYREPSYSRPSSPLSVDSHTYPRSRRSISFTATALPSPTRTSPPTLTHRSNTTPNNRPLSGDSASFSYSSHAQTVPKVTMNAPTSSVATALLRASHKEAQKGVANDLFSILERDSKPWGFSYSDVRQKVKIWYGDRDEKIGEPGIRWMERVMKDCELTICKGRDHNLMTCSAVVVEALESLQADLRKGEFIFTLLLRSFINVCDR